MSETACRRVMDRAMTDEPFLDQFHADPEQALEEYELEEEEKTALLSGQSNRIREVLGDVQAGISVTIVVVLAP